MATVSNSNKSKLVMSATKKQDAPQSSKPNPAPAAKGKRKRGPLRWVFRLLVLAIVLVVAAPYLIAYTPLKNWLAKTALKLNGDVHVGSLSLGWFSPVGVQDLEIRDAAGQPFLKVPSLTGDTPLYKLALSPTQPGKFTIDGLELHLYLRDNGSNAEDIFANWMKPSNTPQPETPSKPSSLPKVALDLKNGTVTLHDETAKQEWKIDQLNAAVSIDAMQPHPFLVKADCSIPTRGAPGSLSIELQAADPSGAPNADGSASAGNQIAVTGANQFALTAANIPLPMFQAFLRRALPQATIDGLARANLNGAWSGSGKDLQLKLVGEADVDQLVLTAPTLLKRDRLALARIQVPCQLAIRGDQLQIDSLGIACDVGQVAVQGTLALNDQLSKELLKNLLQQPFAVNGQVDLVRLAKVLPDTLRIREGTQITGGQVTLALQNKPAAAGPTLNGELQVNNLTALNQGKQVAWNKPLAAVVSAHNAAGSVAVDRLEFDSSFAVATASGTPDAFKAEAQFDLALLTAELEKIVDLGQFNVAGRGNMNVEFKRDANGSMAGEAEATIQNFQYTTATLKMTAIQADVHVVAQSTPLGFDCQKIEAAVKQLHSEGSLSLDEPAVQLAAAARWESDAKRLQLANASLQTSALAAQTQLLSIALPDKGPPVVAGTIAYRGDVNRLQRLLGDPKAKWQFVGAIQGQAQFDSQQAVQTAKIDATLENVALWDYASATSPDPKLRVPAWQDTKVVIAATAGIDRAADALRIDALDVQSETLRLQAAGKIDRLSTQMNADLSGKIDYDLDRVTPLLWPYLGKSVQFTGKDAMQFAFRGPLGTDTPTQVPLLDQRRIGQESSGALSGVGQAVPRSVAATPAAPLWKTCAAQASFGWTAANLYGLQVGKARLGAAIGNGQASIDPINIDIAGGKLTLAPQIQLGESVTQIVLPKGPILQQIHITPDMCAAGLKFVAPLVAMSTKCDGTLSLDTAGAKIPLADPAGTDTGGILTIHSLQVAPGPIAGELLGLAADLESLLMRKGANQNGPAYLTITNQNVEYRVVNHRVYHRGLEMHAGDIVIRSSGSVGFDETLDVLLEIPVLDRWLLPGDPLRLRGTAIQIPLKGSFGKREFDKTGFGKFASDAFKNLGGQIIGDQINKGLDKLFPK